MVDGANSKKIRKAIPRLLNSSLSIVNMVIMNIIDCNRQFQYNVEF